MEERVYGEGMGVMWLSRFRRELAGDQRNEEYGGGGDFDVSWRAASATRSLAEEKTRQPGGGLEGLWGGVHGGEGCPAVVEL